MNMANYEVMRITSAGRVGIGTSSPTAIMQIQGAQAGVSGKNLTISYNGTYYAEYTEKSITAFNNELIFGTGTSGSERMRIAAAGNVGIGNSNPQYKLDILQSGANSALNIDLSYGATGGNAAIIANITTTAGYLALWRYGGSTVGSITTNGSATTYNTTSDYRLKEDLQEINALEKVSAIKIYNYKWKSCDERMDGVLAHELAEVIPYAVNGEKDGEQMQAVDYSKLVPILTKALQEANAKITSLEEKLQRNNIN